jgi:hypothetical protein
VTDTALAEAKASFDRIMVDPSPADLWVLQQALLVVGTEPATRARAVARAFHACLRNLESKSASRTASRWGAVLGTAAVGSVSVGEMGNTREAALQGLVHGAVPAVLEVGAALKSAQAWEVEAGLVYDDLAWFLYDELWDIATTTRPDLSPDERRNQVALVIGPLLDATVPDDDRAALVVQVFRTVLAARLVPLFGESRNGDARNGDALGTDGSG